MLLKRLEIWVALWFCLCAAPPSWGQVSISIDASQTGDPISKYIYGQSIEHVGRSVYGGIWAEMIEDRKFFYAVDGQGSGWATVTPGPGPFEGEGAPYERLVASPWQILGPAEAVRMNGDAPYAGEHSPEVALSEEGGERRGIWQERLGLVEGKDYSGRIVLAATPDAGPFEISLVWGGGASERDTVIVESVKTSYTTAALEFKAGRATDNGRIEIAALGTGHFRVGAVSLMPADHVKGFRRDTLSLLKELDAPVYRWPGGAFAGGYDWKDGLGERDRRPPRENSAWNGVESNDVGIHEFMALCEELGAEPFVVVNFRGGSAEQALGQIEYINGSADTPMGKARAQNGHKKPFGAVWWGIGGADYEPGRPGLAPNTKYLVNLDALYKSMTAANPASRLIVMSQRGEWSAPLLNHAANYTDLIGEHLYVEDVPGDLGEHVAQLPGLIADFADLHRSYRRELKSLEGKDIRIALDAWNLHYGFNEYGERGVRYRLQDGLSIAAGLHGLFNNSDLFFMANYAGAVNATGAIKTTKTAAAFETTGLVLKLYRGHYGEIPIAISGDTGAAHMAAAWNSGRSAITLSIVNPLESRLSVIFEVKGAELTGAGRRWIVAGNDRLAYNEPGREPAIAIQEQLMRNVEKELRVPPLSVTLYELTTKAE